MIAYLAGPMRGLKHYNFPAFHEAASTLREKGWIVYSPAEHDLADGFDPDGPLDGFDFKGAMRWDIGSVLQSDIVVLLPGWRDSTGTKIETTVATAIGTPLIEYPSLEPVQPESVGVKAHRIVHGARRESYGHPSKHFTLVGQLWGSILSEWKHNGGRDLPPELVGLCMIEFKITRELNSHNRDNLYDIAGYAETLDLLYNGE